MNKITISLFVSCFLASALALPVAQEEKTEAAASPSTPPMMTHVHMVVDNDDARRMYYLRYIMQRDDILQHSANTGGRVSVDVDTKEPEKVKRSAQTFFHQRPQPVHEQQPARFQQRPEPVHQQQPQFAHLQQAQPAPPQPEVQQPHPEEARTAGDFTNLGSNAALLAYIKSQGKGRQPLSGDISYTRKRRSAMEEEVVKKETPSNALNDVRRKIKLALAAMLGGGKPKVEKEEKEEKTTPFVSEASYGR